MRLLFDSCWWRARSGGAGVSAMMIWVTSCATTGNEIHSSGLVPSHDLPVGMTLDSM